MYQAFRRGLAVAAGSAAMGVAAAHPGHDHQESGHAAFEWPLGFWMTLEGAGLIALSFCAVAVIAYRRRGGRS